MHRGLAGREQKARAELYIKGKGYLRRFDKNFPMSKKAFILKVTNFEKDKPFEHLTFKRL